MKKVSLNKIACLAGLVAFGLAGPAGAASLEVRDFRSGAHYACVDLADDRFMLSFTHSVSLTPVDDLYTVLGPPGGPYRIRQVAEVFTTHGQGLPSMEGEPDALGYLYEKDRFVLRLDRPIEQLILRSDPRFGNRMESGGLRLDLTAWPYVPILIEPVENCS